MTAAQECKLYIKLAIKVTGTDESKKMIHCFEDKARRRAETFSTLNRRQTFTYSDGSRLIEYRGIWAVA